MKQENENKFHQHLDECEQCRNYPFRPCLIGYQLLKNEATQTVLRGGATWCGLCEKEVKDCICDDLLTRINAAGVLIRICKFCKKHFARCRCDAPEWTTNMGDGALPLEFRKGQGGQ